MGLFENKRFTILSISILVVLNLILIGLVVGPEIGKRDRGDGDRRSNYIAKRLGFTDEQRIAYDSLNIRHREETKALQQKVDEKRREMFRLTRVKDVSTEKADSLTTEIGSLVSNMEFRTYEHISNVRALCTPEQLAQLDSLVQRMIKSRKPDDRDRKDPSSR